MALQIKYNGKTIATLEKGQTATIPCDGKKMATDLVVSISTSVNLISFTINDTTYQAEEGMTWGEWINSKYDTFTSASDLNDVSLIVKPLDYTFIGMNEPIVGGTAYGFSPTGGSN